MPDDVLYLDRFPGGGTDDRPQAVGDRDQVEVLVPREPGPPGVRGVAEGGEPLADQHLLEKKQAEHEESAGNWQRKAALAVTRQQDDLARAALRQQISHQQMAASFAQQLSDQRTETDTLRTALSRLQQRLQETQSRCELLAIEHRRARAAQKATGAGPSTPPNVSGTIARVRGRIDQAASTGRAQQTLLVAETGTNLNETELEERFAAMEREDQIEDLLRELKTQQEQQHRLPGPA